MQRALTVGPSALAIDSYAHPVLRTGLGKLLDLWSEIQGIAQLQNLRVGLPKTAEKMLHSVGLCPEKPISATAKTGTLRAISVQRDRIIFFE